MKKVFLFLVCAASALAASAKVEFKSLSNSGNNTTIVFTVSEDEKDLMNGLGVDNIVFECDGKRYSAKNVSADFGDTTTVTAKFKKLKKFVDARLVFTVNGEERSIDVQRCLTDKN